MLHLGYLFPNIVEHKFNSIRFVLRIDVSANFPQITYVAGHFIGCNHPHTQRGLCRMLVIIKCHDIGTGTKTNNAIRRKTHLGPHSAEQSKTIEFGNLMNFPLFIDNFND